MTLLDCVSDNVVQTTVSDLSGFYSFAGVDVGCYYVAFSVPPSGFSATQLNAAGSTAATDSDIDSTGKTDTFNVVPGTQKSDLDAGFVGTPLSLGGTAWLDSNGDGQQDAAEPVLAGAKVTLETCSGIVVGTTTTDNDGAYSFDGLASGCYKVLFPLPYNHVATLTDTGSDATDSDIGASGSTADIVLTGNLTTVSAGFVEPSVIGKDMWFDANENGIWDAGESGVAAGMVTLEACGTNASLLSVSTDAFGQYLFGGLRPGCYVLEFWAPAGTMTTLANQGANESLDSDVPAGKTVSARTESSYTLTSGTVILTVGAGFIGTPAPTASPTLAPTANPTEAPTTAPTASPTAVPAARISDRVWNDVNGNGVQDAGEPGLAGVSVTLKACDSGVVFGTTVSDLNGMYEFDAPPGCYVVAFGVPPGMSATLANIGSDYTDSDIDQSGETGKYWLNSGVTTFSADAGFIGQPSAIGDFVWDDANGNGRQDSGEVGLAGVDVVLKTASGVPVGTTTTDATGKYSFDNVAPGSYSVEFFNVPGGFVPTLQNAAGTDDSNDSDISSPSSSSSSSAAASASFDLVAGQNKLDVDAGFVAYTSIGGSTWNDANNDGVRQSTEAPLVGVQVTLKTCGDDAVVATTFSTPTAGDYSFDKLVPG